MIFDEDTKLYEWKSCHSYYPNFRRASEHFSKIHMIDPYMWMIWKFICKNSYRIHKHLKIHKLEING